MTLFFSVVYGIVLTWMYVTLRSKYKQLKDEKDK